MRQMRYSAFISYNHRDRQWAAWLHRALESYSLPKRLRGRSSPLGELAAKLPPVFRDREELAASASLGDSVRLALEQSASLIVICSPNGAQSRWVNEEIRAFAALGRRHRIQCLIVGGLPNASRIPGVDPVEEALPAALFETGDEPLAADVRTGQDSRSTARLKLIAGIIGVGYDELRQRELARRQRRLAIVAVTSAIGFAGTSALATYALIARHEATVERDVARQRTLTAERTVAFVQSMFEVSDPSESRGRTVTAREILDLGAAKLDRELKDEPSVHAALGTTVGETYTALGLLHEGEALIDRMLRLPGADLDTRARQYVALGRVKEAQEDDASAARAFRHALALAQDPRSNRPDLIPRSLVGLGDALTSLGDIEGGASLLRRAVAIDQRRGPDAALDLASDLEALGSNRLVGLRPKEAIPLLSAALDTRLRRQGITHPLAIRDLNELGAAAYQTGDLARADTYWRKFLELDQKVLGPNHPEVAAALNNYGLLMIERRNYALASRLLRRALAIHARERSDQAIDLAFTEANLAKALAGTGSTAEAVQHFQKALAIALPRKHRNRAPILGELAALACGRGAVAEGEAMIARARPLMESDYPRDPWRAAWLDAVQAQCLVAGGKGAAARPLIRHAAPIVLARWPAASRYGDYVLRVRNAADRSVAVAKGV